MSCQPRPFVRTWLASDGKTMLRQEYRWDDQGIHSLGPPRIVPATDHVVGSVTPKCKSKCRCDGAPKIERGWFGAEYHGVPWYKRIRIRCPLHLTPMIGCGCLVRLKDWAAEVSSHKDSFDPCNSFFRAMVCAIFGV